MSDLWSVAVLAFPHISPFHLSVPCLVFGDQLGQHAGGQAATALQVDCRVCAEQPGELLTSAGFGLQVSHGLNAFEQADLIIIPSWHDPAEPPSEQLIEALHRAHQRGATIAGLCLGAYVLAAAGLLDGQPATTHWAYAQDFSARYPGVQLNPDVIYIEHGRLVTSAGTAAALDCCLHLVRQRCGAELANRVARRLVIAPHRQGGQAQFIEQPLAIRQRDSRLSGLLDRVVQTLDQAHSIDTLAQAAAMSRRSFTRHFRQLTGGTFGEWLLAQRLGLSQRLLESGDLPITRIAEQAGFQSVESFRLHFRQKFGVSPLAWRKTFSQHKMAA